MKILRKILSTTVIFALLMGISVELTFAKNDLDADDADKTTADSTDADEDADDDADDEADDDADDEADDEEEEILEDAMEIEYEEIEAEVDIEDPEINEDYIKKPKAFLLEVIWGDIDKSIPQDANTTNWSGGIRVDGATAKLVEPIKFEAGDTIESESDSNITWTSEIKSHFDGVMLKVRPDQDGELKVAVGNEFMGEKVFNFEELRKGQVLEFDGGYKIALKVQHPVEYKKKFNKEPRVLFVRWGNLNGGIDLNAEKVDYEGVIRADGNHVKLLKTVLFEDNDEITGESRDVITFLSSIEGHWDGMLVQVKPIHESIKEFDIEKADAIKERVLMKFQNKLNQKLNNRPKKGLVATEDAEIEDEDEDEVGEELELENALEDRSFTIEIGDFSKTFYSKDDFGIFDLGNGNQVEIRDISDRKKGLSEEKYENLIKRKIRLHDKCASVYEFIKEWAEIHPDQELNELVYFCDRASDYNYDDETAEKVVDKIEKFLGQLDKKLNKEKIIELTRGLDQEWEGFKNEAKLNKFKEGLLSFKDVDDSEDVWFRDYVSDVSNLGIVEGYKDAMGNLLGEYRPANNVTVAEILKIGLLTADHDISDIGISLPANFEKHWAKNHFMKGIQLGLHLTKDTGVDPNRRATRAEVIRLILEAFGIDVPEATASSYSDVPANHPALDWIEYATELGIVSGDADGNTFRPDKPINRAEVAKIVDIALEILSDQIVE